MVAESERHDFRTPGRDGELYVGSIYGGMERQPKSLDSAKDFIAELERGTGVAAELVTGEEADKLFSEMALHLALSGADQRVKQ